MLETIRVAASLICIVVVRVTDPDTPIFRVLDEFVCRLATLDFTIGISFKTRKGNGDFLLFLGFLDATPLLL